MQLKRGLASTSCRTNIDKRNENDDDADYSYVDDNFDDDGDFILLIWEDDLPRGGRRVR